MNQHSHLAEESLPLADGGYGYDYFYCGNDECDFSGGGKGMGELIGFGGGESGAGSGNGYAIDGPDGGDSSPSGYIPLAGGDTDLWICWDAEQELG